MVPLDITFPMAQLLQLVPKTNMAASRLLLLRSPIFRIYKGAPPPSSLFIFPSFPLCSRSLFPITAPQKLHFHTHVPLSTAEAAAETVQPISHPWPEWESFIEQLKCKGYFDNNELSPPDEADEPATVRASKDLNGIKLACLSFARERFDIFRSLSKKDIQAVVECGCPNLFRKAVNSAKRLRAYVKLDEGDVCSACNLRGSCDRAYVITKDDERARTVDVVRILLSYATDQLTHAEGEKTQVREHVEASARKLLSELIELSATALDPSLPNPAVKMSDKTKEFQKVSNNDKQQYVEMKRGDWICSKCNFMNFARNVRCLECKEDGPKRVSFDEVEMKKGDWTCSKCLFMNFARNMTCFRCEEARPKRVLNPGEWECPGCDFLNYRRNMVCLKCKCERPKDKATQYEDQTWTKPRVTRRLSMDSNFEDDNKGTSEDDRFSFSALKRSR